MRPVWWLATAAIFFIALWGWSELRVRTVQSQIDEMSASNQQLEEKTRLLEREKQALAATLATVTAPQIQTISLAGQKVAPTASARVYLDHQNRRAFVFFYGLPPNPEDKSYQLWIIRADKTDPQPASVFNVDERGSAQLSVENLPVGRELKALAVTLEPRGGVQTPTGQKYLASTSR